MKFKRLILGLSSIFILSGCSDNNTATLNQNTSLESSISDKSNSEEQKTFDKKVSVASVAISQVLAEMNQEIVGRPTTKLQLPEQYVFIEEIGSSFSPDFEKVLAVGTEFLIADALFKEKIEKTANEYNIETFYVDTSTYGNFITSIEELGKKISKENEAQKIIEKLKLPLEDFKKIDSNLKVAIIFGTSESNMLATENTYIGSLVKEFGAINIANEIIESGNNILETDSSGYLNLNLEQVLQNQPDLILRFGHGNIEEANKSFEKLFSENPAWKNLEAIKNNKVYDLDSNIFGVSASLEMVNSLKILGEILNEN